MLDAARNIANAVLGEGLRRLDLMRESKAYQAARKMSPGEPLMLGPPTPTGSAVGRPDDRLRLIG
jgi:hypothetical protein